MRWTLQQRLDAILEDQNGQPDADAYQAAIDVATELEAARRRVSELERELIHATDRLCGGLAMGVRRAQPGLSVSIDRGACKVGYRSKHLILKPDLTGKIWVVDSSDPVFARRFSRTCAPHTNLSNDTSQVSRVIADFFNNHYKTLGEDIVGTGTILIDGLRSTLGHLAERAEIGNLLPGGRR